MKTIIKPLMMGVIIIAVPQTIPAQSLRNSISMPYMAIRAYTAKQQDVFSFTSNQAALSRLKSVSAGIYGERRFLTEGNDFYALAACLPSSLGNFGLQLNYSGFKNFNEQKAGLAYARSLGSKADVGVQFNYYSYKIPGYGSASAINFEGGFIAHISENVTAGIHAYNPVGGKLGKDKEEKLPSVYELGLGWDVSDNFYTGIEIMKEENAPPDAIAGFQYHFKKQFFARAGFRSDTNSGFGGVGFLYKKIRIDVAASYHPQLGISPGILLMYDLKSAAQ